jgi:hypothetical protein
MTESDSTTTTSQPPIRRRARLAGFPGENQGVLAVLHYADTGTKAHLNAHGPAGLPGMYTVEFVQSQTRETLRKTSSASLTNVEAIPISRSQSPR